MTAGITGTERHRDDAVLLLARYDGCSHARTPQARSLHIQQGDLGGVKTARRFVNEYLAAWGLRDSTDSYQLITSEIVTNALSDLGEAAAGPAPATGTRHRKVGHR
jgi:hypothetical protein